jgi:hypothetical protein
MTEGIPPLAAPLGVTRHLDRCPLCGGPNPLFDGTPSTKTVLEIVPSVAPTVVREPTVPSREQSLAHLNPPKEYQAAPPMPRDDAFGVLDHPVIGGKFTVFVLCYGEHATLARRCLDGILGSVPARRLDLRVGANACCSETLAYLRGLPLTKLYAYDENRYKYPLMREMFRDEECPLQSNYVVWFDDDSYVVDTNWAVRLGETIVENHRHGVRLYGMRFNHDLSPYVRDGHNPQAWFRAAPWWQGIPMGNRRSEHPVPNGSCIHFVTGGFWALGVDALKRGDIPDRRLRHNGGDITIGEQVRQAGFKLCEFNKNKSLVFSSGFVRRGYSEEFQWVRPASA